MEKFTRPSQPEWFKSNLSWQQYMNKKDLRDKLKNTLLEMTNYHCSYTDRLIQRDIAQIDWFKPKSKSDKLDWNNLYIVYPVTNEIKLDKYDDLLIRPDSDEYEFEKFFDIDFETHKILISKNATTENQRRAEKTIEILGLNHENFIEDRKQELIKYFQRVVEIAELKKIKGNEINPNEHKELNLNNFSYRFYLSRALKEFRNEVSENIDEINIKKYFCIDDLHISNLSDKKEIYIIGENGDGKTIALQAIVLALKGLSTNFVYSFSQEYSGNFEIEIKDCKGNKYKFNDYLSSIHKNVFAYGVGRLRKHAKDKDKSGYSSLFDYDSYLTSPTDWFKDIEIAENRKTGKIKLNDVLKIFEQLLENKVKIVIDKKDNTYKFIEKKSELDFNQLSDGFRSTLIWMSDLLGRLIENQPDVRDIKDYQGIVLVDEVGSFLHPKWEFRLIKELKQILPKIQWIFTTHSPIIILGATNDAVIYRLYKEDGITKITRPLNKISGYTANSLLTSNLWLLPTSITVNTPLRKMTDDDYVYQLIHDEIYNRLTKNPSLCEDEIIKLISEKLDKIENNDEKN